MKRKCVMVGIILLFVGITYAPAIAQNTEKSQSSGETWLYVGGSGAKNHSTLQSAIDAANPGDTVFVYNETYHENIIMKKTKPIRGQTSDPTYLGISNNDSIATIKNWFGQNLIRMELAGKSLDNYPFFHYIKTFNENENVMVAIDPTKLLDETYQDVDIYIVDAKTKEEWIVDPSLIDVRSYGPQTEFVQSTAIQDNTFIVSSPYELRSQTGYGLGVGYDVVFDFDQNAVLSNGDIIDGFSTEAGFYIVHDTSCPGPLNVSMIEYSGGIWLTQRTFYPTDIATMKELPLIVISHGWTLQYDHYDYIGYHLASYGYIVMSHTNDVGNGDWDGTKSASTTILLNTDYVLGLNQSTYPCGILYGHIDSHHIVWIGHSTGGEAVVRAYTRLRSGEYTPLYFSYEDIVLISSIAPVSWMPGSLVSPYDVNYHMFIGGADSDCTGAPLDGYVQSMAIFERSYGNKQLHYIHGVGHCDFDDGYWDSWATGPDLIGRDVTHIIVKGYYLPLVELYTKNNEAASDFFKRMYDDFHPIGIPDNVTIATEFKNAENSEKIIIDDYQTEDSLSISSSGGKVTYNITNPSEVVMQDIDNSFYWTENQPSNGMTRARYDDNPRCVVFDWTTGDTKYYEYEVIPLYKDFTKYEYLSFRVCQGTRHPETDAHNASLNFTVTFRDINNITSSINFGNYGGITRTYLRTGYGPGAGWGNEFCTVRIRLKDFQINGIGINLCNIVAIRFNFGCEFGSHRGRIGIDDVELTEYRVDYGNYPNNPSKPLGPIIGKSGEEYTYYTITLDPEGDNIYYKWDWGDGIYTNWIGPFESGKLASANHTWIEDGIYEIRVKAKDSHGAESNWSDPKTMYITSTMVLIGLIKNIVNQSDECTIFNMSLAIIIKMNPFDFKMFPSIQILLVLDEFQGLMAPRILAGRVYGLIL